MADLAAYWQWRGMDELLAILMRVMWNLVSGRLWGWLLWRVRGGVAPTAARALEVPSFGNVCCDRARG